MPLSTKMMATVPKLNEGGTILAEAIVWSLIICVPINVVSITFAMQAPSYIHPDKESFDYGYGYNSIYTANETDAPKLSKIKCCVPIGGVLKVKRPFQSQIIQTPQPCST